MMTYIESKLEGLMAGLTLLNQEDLMKKIKDKDKDNRKLKQ